MNGIEIRGLVKRYPRSTDLLRFLRHPFRREEVVALRGLDFSLAPGRIYGLVGPNGAGKTTLLKILAGLVLPTEGTVRLDGLDVTSGARALRDHVGLVVADERSFFWRLTFRENLRFFATLQKIPARDQDRRVDECLARLDLTDVADRSFRELSTGMRQRLAIARGMLVDPPVLLMDEATRSLDPQAAKDVRESVRAAVRERSDALVIYSTHVLSDVDDLCDEVLVLRGGELLSREELGQRSDDVRRYRLRTRDELPRDLLDGLPDIRSTRWADRQLDLEVASEEGREALVRRVQQRQLGLIELRLVKRSLEDLLEELPRA